MILLATTSSNPRIAIISPLIKRFCTITKSFVNFFADLSNVITNNVKLTGIIVMSPVDSTIKTKLVSS